MDGFLGEKLAVSEGLFSCAEERQRDTLVSFHGRSYRNQRLSSPSRKPFHFSIPVRFVSDRNHALMFDSLHFFGSVLRSSGDKLRHHQDSRRQPHIGVIVGIILGFIRGMFRGRTPGLRAGPFKRFPVGFPSSTHIAQFGGTPDSGLSTNQTRVVAGSELGIPGPGWGIGDILAGVLGMAWTVATFFVIPIMIYEKLSPLRALKRSVEIIRDLWKETLILKFGFKAIFTLLGILGLLFILLGVMAGVTFLPQPVELMGGKGTTSVIVTNAPPLIAGFAVAIAYWIALACVSFALKGILKAALYEYSRKTQVEPNVQPQQAAEFNSLSNIIRSFQSE